MQVRLSKRFSQGSNDAIHQRAHPVGSGDRDRLGTRLRPVRVRGSGRPGFAQCYLLEPLELVTRFGDVGAKLGQTPRSIDRLLGSLRSGRVFAHALTRSASARAACNHPDQDPNERLVGAMDQRLGSIELSKLAVAGFLRWRWRRSGDERNGFGWSRLGGIRLDRATR